MIDFAQGTKCFRVSSFRIGRRIGLLRTFFRLRRIAIGNNEHTRHVTQLVRTGCSIRLNRNRDTSAKTRQSRITRCEFHNIISTKNDNFIERLNEYTCTHYRRQSHWGH